MNFANKLKELRRARGISQAELADALHVSRSAVAKWENGLGMPGKESLSILADYFAVSEEELVIVGEDRGNKNKMSDKDKKVIIRAAIISVSVFFVLTIAGIFIEPIGDFISSFGICITFAIFSIANIVRILKERKSKSSKESSRSEDNSKLEK